LPVILISPLAGVLADHFKRKYLVVLMDLLSGFLLIFFYYISMSRGLSRKISYITTFFMTLFSTVLGVSLEAGKPNMVSAEKLMTINFISKIIDSISSILGPMFGGLIYARVDIKIFILVNGVSFIVSGISEIFIDFNYNLQGQKKQKAIRLIQDIKEGFQYMKTQRQLMKLLLLFVIINFFISLSVTVPLPFIINNVLKLSSRYYGIIQSALPFGMILGSIVVKKVSEKASYDSLLLKMSFSLSICMMMVGLPLLFLNADLADGIYLIYYCIVVGGLGMTIALIDFPIIYILQKTIADVYRGRVLSLFICIAKIIVPMALILSGIFMNYLYPWVLPNIGGGLLLMFSLAMYKKKLFIILAD
jgi:hypothetical protein